MAQSVTDPTFSLPGATTPLAGTEDVVTLQGQFAVQTQLTDLMNGLVASKGGASSITGSRGTATATVLGALLTALASLGLIQNNTVA